MHQILQGEIYKLTLYNDLLTNSQINENYNKKLTNSLPVAWNITVRVQENGEVGSHYSTPAFYLEPVPTSELCEITLPLFDLDNDQKSPHYSIETPCSLAVIVSLPTNGILYDANSAVEITQIGYTVSCLSNYRVKYRPSFNKYSGTASTVFDSFTISALDGVTQMASTETGTINIVVDKVYLPPRPKNNLTIVMVYADVPTQIVLQSIDPTSYIFVSIWHLNIYSVHIHCKH